MIVRLGHQLQIDGAAVAAGRRIVYLAVAAAFFEVLALMGTDLLQVVLECADHALIVLSPLLPRTNFPRHLLDLVLKFQVPFVNVLNF